MKKYFAFIFFVFLILTSFAEDFRFINTKESSVFQPSSEGYTTLQDEIKLPKDIEVTFTSNSLIRLIYFKRAKAELAYIDANKECGGYLSISNLIPTETEDVLSEDLISVNVGIKKKYIPAYMLDILKTGDTEKLTEYDYRYAKEYHESRKKARNSYIAYGFEKKFYYAVISNIGIRLHSDDNFIFTNIKKINPTKYECTGVGFSEWDPYRENTNYWQTYFENTSELGIENEVIELTVDGDYLTVFNKTRNKEIIKLVCINDSVEAGLISLFNTDSCDVFKVTWPRHADGSCDYEDNKSTNTVVSTNKTTTTAVTNVAQNKIMTVNENLKLRSGEATTTSVLTVMQAGTKVKILELGKAENIDGINSNWVKVEVQKGAKDRGGKEIKEGTVGWCYGGYLK